LRQFPPSRIVCLTEETIETLYLLGEQDRIVGVSGYAVRPPQVRREKPRVSAFTSADIPKIRALEPDLVLTFSDLQAEIAAELIGAGIAVHAFNGCIDAQRPAMSSDTHPMPLMSGSSHSSKYTFGFGRPRTDAATSLRRAS
jgi:ABC-type Fe3+-hydroxamate transport system substrate-binding protein